MQKFVDRSEQAADKIFDSRTVQKDYHSIVGIIKPGMSVLDVGCGTGAISKGIAELVGPTGKVIGIDNTRDFIESGKRNYAELDNLELVHADIFDYSNSEKFDLVVSARTLQWLSKPNEAIRKMITFLKPNGILSVLDYIHEDIEWNPKIPESMANYYSSWLKWRSDNGMNNRMAECLPIIFNENGLRNVEVRESNETYLKDQDDFEDKLGIWIKVASSKQLIEEQYVTEELRQKAILDYQNWISSDAQAMQMMLKEVRGQKIE